MLEALIVGLSNFVQIALRTLQVILVTRDRRVWAGINGCLIATAYLISTLLGLKGLKEGDMVVVAVYILSNGLASWSVLTIRHHKEKA